MFSKSIIATSLLVSIVLAGPISIESTPTVSSDSVEASVVAPNVLDAVPSADPTVYTAGAFATGGPFTDY